MTSGLVPRMSCLWWDFCILVEITPWALTPSLFRLYFLHHFRLPKAELQTKEDTMGNQTQIRHQMAGLMLKTAKALVRYAGQLEAGATTLGDEGSNMGDKELLDNWLLGNCFAKILDGEDLTELKEAISLILGQSDYLAFLQVIGLLEMVQDMMRRGAPPKSPPSTPPGGKPEGWDRDKEG